MATNLEFIKSASGTSVTSINVTNCFSDKYDVYAVTVTDISATAGGILEFRLIDSVGSVISASEYDYAYLQVDSWRAFIETKATGATTIDRLTYLSTASTGVGGGYHYIFNPYDSSSYTFTTSQGIGWLNGSGSIGTKGIGVHKSAEQITGVQVLTNSTGFSGTVNVFGVK
jgi:hypothetical protein